VLSRWVKSFRIREALREVEGGRSVLDLGCGLCELALRLPTTIRYVGVEREPWMLERARRLLPERRFLGADLEDPAFDPGGSFDRLLLVAVWEHLADPASFVRRSIRWVEPGGRLVLSTPSPRGRIPIEWGSRIGLLSRHADDEHERLWSLEEVRRVAGEAGWKFLRGREFLFGFNQIVVFERPVR
jgi:SAM-dependent methyltransferase